MAARERPYQDIHLVEIWGPSHSVTTKKDAYHKASNELVEKAGFTIMPGSDFVYPGIWIDKVTSRHNCKPCFLNQLIACLMISVLLGGDTVGRSPNFN